MMGSRKVRVFVHQGPADMRKSYDTLGSLVRHQMNADLAEGDLFLFIGKDRKRAKVLFFDGTGMCIFQKRLGRGCFANPWGGGGRAQMTHSELTLFLEGCTQVGRMELSPRPLGPTDMTLRPDDFV